MEFEKVKLNAKKIIAVASGKGGVGKTTVAVNLSLALAEKKKKVGLLDADIYGPNVPQMLGIYNQHIITKGDKMVPVSKYNLDIMSVGFITQPKQALIWRGPLAAKLIDQFLREVQWENLDYLIIDLPPGTGDVPLSIIQKVELSSGLIVTTPQQASIMDVKKMIDMYEKTEVKISGIVENMKYLLCPGCSKKINLFPKSSSEEVSKIFIYPVLAEFPFDPDLNRTDGVHKPFYLSNKNSLIRKQYDDLALKFI